MTKLTTSQRFALGQTLSDYNPHLTYQELQDRITSYDDDQDCSDDFTAWEPFEHMDPQTLCDTMDELEFAFRQYATQITRSLRDSIREGDPMTIAERLASLENQLGV